MLQTYSSIKTFQTCPRLYYYKYILGYRSIIISEVLSYGTMIHKWLEKYHSGKEGNWNYDITDNCDPYDNAKFRALIEGYKVRWNNNILFIDETYNQKCEDIFVDNLLHTTGKIDCVCLADFYRECVLVENKTSGGDITPGSFYWLRLQLDMQIGLYMLAKIHAGLKPLYLLYNVIGKVMLRPKNKGKQTEETPDEFYIRILEHIAENPDRYYQRGKVIFSKKDIEEIKSDISNTINLINTYHSNNYIYARNTGYQSCFQYNRTCDFFPVCSSETGLENKERYRRIEGDNFHEELKEDE